MNDDGVNLNRVFCIPFAVIACVAQVFVFAFIGMRGCTQICKISFFLLPTTTQIAEVYITYFAFYFFRIILLFARRISGTQQEQAVGYNINASRTAIFSAAQDKIFAVIINCGERDKSFFHFVSIQLDCSSFIYHWLILSVIPRLARLRAFFQLIMISFLWFGGAQSPAMCVPNGVPRVSSNTLLYASIRLNRTSSSNLSALVHCVLHNISDFVLSSLCSTVWPVQELERKIPVRIRYFSSRKWERMRSEANPTTRLAPCEQFFFSCFSFDISWTTAALDNFVYKHSKITFRVSAVEHMYHK